MSSSSREPKSLGGNSCTTFVNVLLIGWDNLVKVIKLANCYVGTGKIEAFSSGVGFAHIGVVNVESEVTDPGALCIFWKCIFKMRQNLSAATSEVQPIKWSFFRPVC